MSNIKCMLGLEDGSVFAGHSFGAAGTREGEVVFNTALTGYQEILTDPSYCGQIVVMTMPQIGNYGVNADDMESAGQHLSGFVVRELSRIYSNHRATGDLHEYLRAAGVVGITGVDTRAITRRLRETGSLRGVISTEIADAVALVAKAKAGRVMTGQNLVQRVMPSSERLWTNGELLNGEQPPPAVRPGGPPPRAVNGLLKVVAIDCGIKHNILRELAERGCCVRVVPASAGVKQIMEGGTQGVLVGNGPGDPEAVTDTIDTLRELIGKVPIFGICLGHQLLSLALGAKTYKLKFGHHGANHPVLNHDTGRVEITSQNHGFAVDVASLQSIGGRVTHTNLYDQSLEGFAHEKHKLFAVQYHPEAAPGPHDSEYLFQTFIRLMRGEK
jgi:carbamoyl-phosphate synthase small subunit